MLEGIGAKALNPGFAKVVSLVNSRMSSWLAELDHMEKLKAHDVYQHYLEWANWPVSDGGHFTKNN